MEQATFIFHESLNDFLQKRANHTWHSFSFHTPASVKDAIEALGVPHVEVKKIVVNESEESFSYRLQANDKVEVFPYKNHFSPNAPHAFVLDVHLGKLARLLRLLGIDAVYKNDLHDSEIVSIAVAENRAVLTRDVGLLKHKVLACGYWLRSQHAEEQLLEVIKMFSLCGYINPFSRCITCNGTLLVTPKKDIIHLLPEKTKNFFEEFYRCENCSNIYWKGSHYQNMQRRVERIKSLAC